VVLSIFFEEVAPESVAAVVVGGEGAVGLRVVVSVAVVLVSLLGRSSGDVELVLEGLYFLAEVVYFAVFVHAGAG